MPLPNRTLELAELLESEPRGGGQGILLNRPGFSRPKCCDLSCYQPPRPVSCRFSRRGAGGGGHLKQRPAPKPMFMVILARTRDMRAGGGGLADV